MKIVFVHFGPKIPQLLIQNIRRTCDLFPDYQVVLLADNSHKNGFKRSNVKIERIVLHEQYSEIEHRLSHPREFRNNFWFISLARLTAIADFMIENNSAVLHIESDVLISGDFPIEKFLELDRPIAYTILGENSGVASVFWLSSVQAAMELKHYINHSVLIDANTTDMRILGHFQRENPEMVRVLASFPKEEVHSFRSVPDSIAKDFVYTRELFKGFFDAADFGQYLFGDDPRNHRGIKYVRRELDTSYLSPRKLNYLYSKERSFLKIDVPSHGDVFSLHIHSKDVSVFRASSSAKQIQKAIKNSSLPEKHILVSRVLIDSIWKSIVRRSRRLFTVS